MKVASNAMGISVIMPTYNQANFIRRSIISLIGQDFKNWQLVIVNDGCTDDTFETIAAYLTDSRIKYICNDRNLGLGASLNKGIANSDFDLIAYLPSDDIYYKNHLQLLYDTLINERTEMAVSGFIFRSNEYIGQSYGIKNFGKIEDYPIQLVQVLHVKNNKRWVERDLIETDDLGKLFWDDYVKDKDCLRKTGKVTCEWVDHPMQRHKLINEFYGGGIYKFKKYYQIDSPIRMQSMHGNCNDELEFYKPLQRNIKFHKNDRLKLVLVGDLSYNPERILAFENLGYQLYGIWLENPSNHTTIGPLPFGNVEDIKYKNWQKEIKKIKPDIIYGLSNYQSIPIAHEVLTHSGNIPFIWHLKEGPFDARLNGTWDQLIELYKFSDGQMYHCDLMRKWYLQFIDIKSENSIIVDGELPSKIWFTDERSNKLSNQDGEIHIIFAGRPVGFGKEEIRDIVRQKIHLHFYGDIFHTAYRELITIGKELDEKYIHLHPNCTQENWVREFSKYDAGWMHHFNSENEGELFRLNWLDLNLPARFSTYAMAGIPILLKDNCKHLVASQLLASELDVGLFYNSLSDLSGLFADRQNLTEKQTNMWNSRMTFCFDNYIQLIDDFFCSTKKNK